MAIVPESLTHMQLPLQKLIRRHSVHKSLPGAILGVVSITTAISGHIQGFVKGGAYLSSISLKQEVWGSSPEAIGLLYF